MDTFSKYVPLIHLTQGCRGIPWESIDENLVAAVRKIALENEKKAPVEYDLVLRLLECFLQITGRHLSLADLQRSNFLQICTEFIGALYSKKFWSTRTPRRGHCARHFLRFISALRRQYSAIPEIDITPSYRDPLSSTLIRCVNEFEKLEWIEEQAYKWHGWPAQTGDGRYTCIQLYPIYARLGRAFTDQIHSAYQLFVNGRRAAAPIAANELAKFISTYEGDLKPENFKSSEFMTSFWRRFAQFYVGEAISNNKNVVNAISDWRRRFVFFVKNYLEDPGIVARTPGAFPSPPKRHPDPTHGHIKKNTDGFKVKTKLLTPVPLQISDAQALDLLFHRIEHDLNIVMNWARSEISEIWGRYINRIELARVGTARTITLQNRRARLRESEDWLMSQDNPDHLANACATFETYGYLHISDISALHRIYPLGTREMAHLFALPTTGTLLPHCALLTALHPKITSILLESLELYSPSGQMVGFVETNGAKYIIGTKSRKTSASDKEQRIELGTEAGQVVEQIIAITSPLRTYLKAKGDSSWRYLILSCGEAFGRPCKTPPLSNHTTRKNIQEKNIRGVVNSTNTSIEHAEEIIENFSLATVRASAALLIYLKTGDMKKMSEALGHRTLSLQLLDHYLPHSIRDFFQERWIRIFQQSLVIDALKESEYILEATSFESMESVNEFLTIHALNRLPEKNNQTNKRSVPKSEVNEVVIGINTGILIALLSLKSAVDNAVSTPNSLACYWASFAERIAAFIDSDECRRPDLKVFISKARASINPSAFSKIIYG